MTLLARPLSEHEVRREGRPDPLVRGDECYACGGEGQILNRSDRIVDCPYCRGTGLRHRLQMVEKVGYIDRKTRRLLNRPAREVQHVYR